MNSAVPRFRTTPKLALPFLLLLGIGAVSAHEGHGKALPAEAKALKNPLTATPEHLQAGERLYKKNCAMCHGVNGKPMMTGANGPTNLTAPAMDSMRDGEIFYVITHGMKPGMPAMEKALNETERWEVVLWTRDLRKKAH